MVKSLKTSVSNQQAKALFRATKNLPKEMVSTKMVYRPKFIPYSIPLFVYLVRLRDSSFSSKQNRP